MRRRVLLVEDNPMLIFALSTALELSEFEVQHADEGAQVARSVAEFHPDALLVDRWLPDMDGADLIETLRSAGFGGLVVMMTGDCRPETQTRARSCGANHLLLKPFEVERLLALLG